MCRIDERIYIRPDGHRTIFQDSFMCDRGKRRGRTCHDAELCSTEHPDPILSPIASGPLTPNGPRTRRVSTSGRPSSIDGPIASFTPNIHIEFGSKKVKRKITESNRSDSSSQDDEETQAGRLRRGVSEPRPKGNSKSSVAPMDGEEPQSQHLRRGVSEPRRKGSSRSSVAYMDDGIVQAYENKESRYQNDGPKQIPLKAFHTRPDESEITRGDVHTVTPENYTRQEDLLSNPAIHFHNPEYVSSREPRRHIDVLTPMTDDNTLALRTDIVLGDPEESMFRDIAEEADNLKRATEDSNSSNQESLILGISGKNTKSRRSMRQDNHEEDDDEGYLADSGQRQGSFGRRLYTDLRRNASTYLTPGSAGKDQYRQEHLDEKKRQQQQQEEEAIDADIAASLREREKIKQVRFETGRALTNGRRPDDRESRRREARAREQAGVEAKASEIEGRQAAPKGLNSSTAVANHARKESVSMASTLAADRAKLLLKEEHSQLTGDRLRAAMLDREEQMVQQVGSLYRQRSLSEQHDQYESLSADSDSDPQHGPNIGRLRRPNPFRILQGQDTLQASNLDPWHHPFESGIDETGRRYEGQRQRVGPWDSVGYVSRNGRHNSPERRSSNSDLAGTYRSEQIGTGFSKRPPSIASDDAVNLEDLPTWEQPITRISLPQSVGTRRVENDPSADDSGHSWTQHFTQEDDSEEDRRSVLSIESSTTLVSTLSGITAVDVASATLELRRVLQENPNLVKIYRVATKNLDIGPDRLQRNLGRLLKQMAQDLKTEADKELERLTSRFVAMKAKSMAYCIVEDIRSSQHNVNPQEIDKLSTGRLEGTYGEEAEESESDQGENLIDENHFEDLAVFRTFLVESEAFQMFQSRLAAFVTPKAGQTVEAKIEDEAVVQVPRSSTSLRWLGNIYTAILGMTGTLKSQIPGNAVRLSWKCSCGDVFFSDVYEHRTGGVQRLKERMQRSGCLNLTITTCNQQSSHQGITLQVPPWLRTVGRKMSASLTNLNKASLDNVCLPQYQTSNVSQASKAPDFSKPVSQPELYLMSCMHRTQHHIKVSQDLLQDITTDQQLFHFLRHQIKLYRGSFRSLLSMRRVDGIFFVKFRLRKNSVAEVRHHKYCCTAQVCECIPPQSRVIKPPMGSGEYDCNPSGPPDTWPPVCPEFMMHMFHSPACIAEDDTSILEQIPKKMDCRLNENGASLPEGWGLYFQEDIDVSGVVAVVFAALGVASLVFLIVWTVCKDDIQGASGVSAYIVAVASMLGIWIATKSKSFV